MIRSKYIIWILSLSIATILVLTDTGTDYIGITMHSDSTPPLLRLFLWPSIWWYTSAVLAVGVYFFSRRFLLTREQWKTSLPFHLLGVVVYYLVHVAVQVASMALPAFSHLHPTWSHAISHHLATSIFQNLIVYWSIVGASHAFIFYSRYRKREIQAAQLESELHKAQLKALKMQLQPHFLFNTLNAISILMYRDVAAADRTVAKLGDLLRRTIDQSGINTVPLHEEIDFIQNYLDIERARFGDQLNVTVECSPGVELATIPNLLLQPIVENAIKHGVSQSSEPGFIEIKAWSEEDTLRVTVRDNGPGIQNGHHIKKGTGLTNTRERLENLYGTDFSLTFNSTIPRGALVSLTIPLSFAPIVNEPVELS